MDNRFGYENRDQLYTFLIDDLGFIKMEERYEERSFGNFYVILSCSCFLLRYVNDRSYMVIEIASHSDRSHWYNLAFIRDLLYNPDKINADEMPVDNHLQIESLNNFLKIDFDRICELFTERIYPVMKERLDELLKEQFKRNFR